jgi:hypothetical protein
MQGKSILKTAFWRIAARLAGIRYSLERLDRCARRLDWCAKD